MNHGVTAGGGLAWIASLPLTPGYADLLGAAREGGGRVLVEAWRKGRGLGRYLDQVHVLGTADHDYSRGGGPG